MDESARVMYSPDRGQETYGPRGFTWEAWKEGAIAEENQVLIGALHAKNLKWSILGTLGYA